VGHTNSGSYHGLIFEKTRPKGPWALCFFEFLCYNTQMETDQLLAHAKARFGHAAAKKLLKEKYQARMTFAHAGGMWCAGPELQTTLLSCPDSEAVLLDLYENPVKINTRELLAMSQQRWQEQMNAWLVEYQQCEQQR
jgi:hypothetical protein